MTDDQLEDAKVWARAQARRPLARGGLIMPLAPYEPPRLMTVQDERQDRAEALRLTQMALHVEVSAYDLIRAAHWVHTGDEIPIDADVEDDGPDAATWTAGDET